MQETKSSNYMTQLDALRAMAVLGVMVNHFLPESLPLNSIFQPGSLGVRLFFVLSGFLITGILLKCKDIIHSTNQTSLFTLKRFYIRRFLRIFPIYYLILFLGFFLQIESVRKAFFWHFTYMSNIYFQFKGSWDSETAHFWTLSIEEQFYLIWPFLIIFARRNKLSHIIFLTIIIAPLFRWLCIALKVDSISIGNVITLAHLDSLGIGALLAYIKHEKSRFISVFMNLCFWFGIPLVVALHIIRLAYPDNTMEKILGSTILSIFFAWVIARAAIGFPGVAGNILERKELLYVGKISYGIYVYHLFMPWVTKCLFVQLDLPYPKSMLIKFTLNITATILVSIVSYHLIEYPINNFKKNFEYAISR